MSGTACSKGLKQRVHEVVRRDGRVLVRLASAPEKVESDTYAFKTPPPSGGGMAPLQKLRSGQVLRAGAAGSRRPPLTPDGAAGDVVKSMSGADGRAPWARSSSTAACFQLGGMRKAAVNVAASVDRASVGGAAGEAAGEAAGGAAGGAAEGAASSRPRPQSAIAHELKWSRHVIHARVEVGRRSVRLTLRGTLPSTSTGDWTCGAHAMVRLEGGEGGEQPYTPYQRVCASAAGSFELVIKAYPEGGLSPRIAALQPGDALLLRGPMVAAQLRPVIRPGVRAIGLVAGGTGVTPMLQIIYSLVRSVAANERGELPRMTLLCFNRRADDVLVADELAELSDAHPEVRIFLSLSDPPAAWAGGRGRPSKEALQLQLPPPAPDVQVFWCGPPAFNSTVRTLVGELGYTDDMVHEFS